MAHPAKAIAKNLATAVREMRDAQKEYFKEPHGTPAKAQILARSKKAEAKVDAMLSATFQTLEALGDE